MGVVCVGGSLVYVVCGVFSVLWVWCVGGVLCMLCVVYLVTVI